MCSLFFRRCRPCVRENGAAPLLLLFPSDGVMVGCMPSRVQIYSLILPGLASLFELMFVIFLLCEVRKVGNILVARKAGLVASRRECKHMGYFSRYAVSNPSLLRR
ncbi:hypothetical protein L798_04112 [Zootermopsis nevadensis]|uniref:Uncharacterized protein n=1 Tax=Zootermopsis nevadensis TaxID=136037 RepID=A0A067QFY3_ZOONE|nr:hypothetical protein L798_04112 [Zootermopsis nevadensis]